MANESEYFLDMKGFLCPLPVLKTQKFLRSVEDGAVVTVEADDPASVLDFPHFCNESGHVLVEVSREGDVHIFRIRKKSGTQ